MVGVAGGGVGVTGVWVMRLCYTRSVCEVAVPERVQLLRVDPRLLDGVSLNQLFDDFRRHNQRVVVGDILEESKVIQRVDDVLRDNRGNLPGGAKKIGAQVRGRKQKENVINQKKPFLGASLRCPPHCMY